ncbi:hypothetical protein GCK72_020757 [Caenorhabditis remanei]|uniref:DUF281 domain-containing protein n=1 Tax=Caenorhabditis remanei TaxID=31234 RepID=A0A6A5GG52_CAERE|nr:hypothetical protein GCK72_020757 [Caenorhabditis remanei]KAF1754197.1 hypothetical protein GCK72_020757 [Caenorhabditis remanei]
MVFRKLLIYISIISFVNSCIRTIPPEEVYISSTAANLPTEEPGTPGTDEPVTGEPVTGEPVTGEPVTGEPTSLCNTCKIDAIKPTLTDPATVFTQSDVPGECLTTDVKCARTDTQVCTDIKMTANGIEIGSVTNNKEVTATLKCREDGSYSSGEVVGITQLACNFMGCAEPTPCSKCNVDALVPQMEPGTSLTYKQVLFIKSEKKLHNSVANSMTARIRLVSFVYICARISTFSACTACNFAALTPQPADIGGKLVATESIDRHGCTEAQVICLRDDNKVCTSVQLIANLASGPKILREGTNTGTVQETAVCRNNIVYPYGSRVPQPGNE